MPDIIADPPARPCYPLFSDRESKDFNRLILISFPAAPAARAARVAGWRCVARLLLLLFAVRKIENPRIAAAKREN